jgi:hypothetical protein
VDFIQHNCFGINFIHTFHHVGSFIQKIRLLAFIIQKFNWFSTFILKFHPCTHGKIFPYHSYMAWRYCKNICPHHQDIPNIFVLAHRLMLTSSHLHFVVSLCSFSTLIHYYKHFWWSRNSHKELANDYVSLVSKRSIVWKTEVIISCP